MRLIYPKGKKFRLGRRADERWHLMRTLLTQLITHDRIKTTYHKAKYLRPTIERVIANTKRYKKEDRLYMVDKKFGGHLTTQFAKDKLKNELMEQFENKNSNFTRIKKLNRRKGDNALTAYIELIGNKLEIYEKEMHNEKLLSGEIKDQKVYENKIFNEEKDFFEGKLNECLSDLEDLKSKLETAENSKNEKEIKEIKTKINDTNNQIDFFNKQIDIVNHDLYILNKSKHDIIKFARIY